MEFGSLAMLKILVVPCVVFEALPMLMSGQQILFLQNGGFSVEENGTKLVMISFLRLKCDPEKCSICSNPRNNSKFIQIATHHQRDL